MKTLKKLLFGATLFTLSLTACGTSEAPIAEKRYAFSSITEVSVDEGFYDVNSDVNINGKDKNEFATHITAIFAGEHGNSFTVGETGISGLTYNGQSIKPYTISYMSDSGFNSIVCYILPTSDETVYKLYRNKAGSVGELEDCKVTIGNYEHSKSGTSGSVEESRSSVATFGDVKYNKSEDTLTFPLNVTDTRTVNDETTVKKASFTVVWKKA